MLPEFQTTGQRDSPLLHEGLEIYCKVSIWKIWSELCPLIFKEVCVCFFFLSLDIPLLFSSFMLSFCFDLIYSIFLAQIVINWDFTCCFLLPILQKFWKVIVWLCTLLCSWFKVYIKLRLLLQQEALLFWFCD